MSNRQQHLRQKPVGKRQGMRHETNMGALPGAESV